MFHLSKITVRSFKFVVLKTKFFPRGKSCLVNHLVGWYHFTNMTSTEFLNVLITIKTCLFIFFYLIRIHSMLAWTATTRHGITRKRSTKRLKHTDNLFRKTGLFILDLKPLKSQVKDKHSIGREFQSLAPSE